MGLRILFSLLLLTSKFKDQRQFRIENLKMKSWNSWNSIQNDERFYKTFLAHCIPNKYRARIQFEILANRIIMTGTQFTTQIYPTLIIQRLMKTYEMCTVSIIWQEQKTRWSDRRELSRGIVRRKLFWEKQICSEGYNC